MPWNCWNGRGGRSRHAAETWGHRVKAGCLLYNSHLSPCGRLPMVMTLRARVILAAALLAAAWFAGLGQRDLFQTDEGRYAEIPREMLATGDWVTPRLDGLKYFEKPPLQYWATAVAYSAFGASNGSSRLWTASTGFLCILMTAFAGARLFDRKQRLARGADAPRQRVFHHHGAFQHPRHGCDVLHVRQPVRLPAGHGRRGHQGAARLDVRRLGLRGARHPEQGTGGGGAAGCGVPAVCAHHPRLGALQAAAFRRVAC